MLMRICNRCGKQAEQGKSCSCRVSSEKERNRQYDRHRRNRERADFYKSKAWTKTVARIRQLAGYKDELIEHETGQYIEGGTVHHIHTLDSCPSRALDLTNLVLVSPRTHKRIHDAYNAGEEKRQAMICKLEKIARERQERASDRVFE